MQKINGSIDFKVKQVDAHNKELIERKLEQQYATRVAKLKAMIEKLEADRSKLKTQIIEKKSTKLQANELDETHKQANLRGKMLSLENQIDKLQERLGLLESERQLDEQTLTKEDAFFCKPLSQNN